MPVQFCRNCINMLYPKENTAKRRADGTRELVYACRNCDYTQVVKTPRDPVYRNLLQHDATEKMAISYDVVLDPTLPHTYNYMCPECDHQEAVYYQSPVGKNDEALVLVFVCVSCNNTWLSSDQ